MARIFRFLGLQAGDTRKLGIMGPVFFAGGVAELLSYTAFMALFNLRFGVKFLPIVYIIEAVILPLEGLILSYIANRMSKPQLMRTLYILMTSTVLINGIILLMILYFKWDIRYYYPILFLSSNFVVRQFSLLMWSLAFDLCPTQQAKRLMPIFVALATLGGITAGLIAQVVGPLLGTEYVYFLASLILIAGFWNFRKAIHDYLVPLTLKLDKKERQINQTASSGQSNLKQLLKSPFLLCAVGLMTLMPALYFLIEYQYFTTAQGSFSSEHELTSFYGRVFTILFTVSLLLQLVSGKLMNWLGASNMLLAISGVFTGGFILAACFIDSRFALVAISISYIFIYLLYYYFAEPCYQLFFKMLPLAQRDGFRFLAQGIAASAGILLGALLSLLNSGGYIPMTIQAILGIIVSGSLVALAWYSRQLYIKELIKSIQGMNSFVSEVVASFLGGVRNSKAITAVIELLKHPNNYVREIALEIMARFQDVALLPRLFVLVQDPSPRIRLAALKAMNLHNVDLIGMVTVAACLEDTDYEVRAQAVKVIAQADHLKEQAHYFIRLKLLDPDPRIVTEGIKALYTLKSTQSYAACEEAIDRLLMEDGDAPVLVCNVIQACNLTQFSRQVNALLWDDRPAVKVAAVECLGKLKDVHIVPQLLTFFPLADHELHEASLQALIDLGETIIPDLTDVLKESHPMIWSAAVKALSSIWNETDVKASLIEPCIERVTQLNTERKFVFALEQMNHLELASLAEKRFLEIRQALHDAIWSVIGRLADAEVVNKVRQAIDDEDEEVRDNGLEVLAEGLGDRRLASVLLEDIKQWDQKTADDVTDSDSLNVDSFEFIKAELEANDHWLRVIAVDALSRKEIGSMHDERVYLSLLERVIFLKQVPMFDNLSLEELGLIADIAREEFYPDETILLRAGEINDTLYLIISGNVELSSVSSEGLEGSFGVLGPKESLGDTSILEHIPSSLTGQVLLGEIHVLEMNGEDLTRLVRRYPEIGIGLLRAASRRVRLLEKMIIKMG
ncbi:HEAT repeat domain-containing protein [Paenibacillus psychroresistens]|uniref:HEAT repeat domain-containing protein n=1 Tax=Paenibacillus psychroresistens TaxID=1778678 RepID=UPI001391B1AD|nr:HEAT repeat domain-containing protein [Paenibacillus psychroresistens]